MRFFHPMDARWLFPRFYFLLAVFAVCKYVFVALARLNKRAASSKYCVMFPVVILHGLGGVKDLEESRSSNKLKVVGNSFQYFPRLRASYLNRV